MLRGQLNYSKTFGEWHNLSAIAGAEVRSSFAKSLYAKRYGYDPITGNHANPVYPSNSSGNIEYERLQSYAKIMDGLNGQSILEEFKANELELVSAADEIYSVEHCKSERLSEYRKINEYESYKEG